MNWYNKILIAAFSEDEEMNAKWRDLYARKLFSGTTKMSLNFLRNLTSFFELEMKIHWKDAKHYTQTRVYSLSGEGINLEDLNKAELIKALKEYVTQHQVLHPPEPAPEPRPSKYQQCVNCNYNNLIGKEECGLCGSSLNQEGGDNELV
jgi:hypothetical protein